MTTTPANPRAARSTPAAPSTSSWPASDLRIRGIDGDHVSSGPATGARSMARSRSRPRPAWSGSGTGRARSASARCTCAPGLSGLDIDVPADRGDRVRTVTGDVVPGGRRREPLGLDASGDIQVAVAGPVAIDSMSGDAVVGLPPPGLIGRTVSGDVRVRAPRLDGSSFSTTSGDVHLAAAIHRRRPPHRSSVVSGTLTSRPTVRPRGDPTITGDVRWKGPHPTEGGRGNRTVVVGDGSVGLSVSTTRAMSASCPGRAVRPAGCDVTRRPAPVGPRVRSAPIAPGRSRSRPRGAASSGRSRPGHSA